MTNSEILLKLRTELQVYFEEQAKKLKLQLTFETDPNILDISDLLYYEIRDLRGIRIYLDRDSSFDIDWYIKDDGTEGFPIKMLAIFLNGHSLEKELLWSVYSEWMIDQKEGCSLARRRHEQQ